MKTILWLAWQEQALGTVDSYSLYRITLRWWSFILRAPLWCRETMLRRDALRRCLASIIEQPSVPPKEGESRLKDWEVVRWVLLHHCMKLLIKSICFQHSLPLLWLLLNNCSWGKTSAVPILLLVVISYLSHPSACPITAGWCVMARHDTMTSSHTALLPSPFICPISAPGVFSVSPCT